MYESMKTSYYIIIGIWSKCCLKNGLFWVHFALRLLQNLIITCYNVFMDSYIFLIDFFKNLKKICHTMKFGQKALISRKQKVVERV